MIYFFYSTWRQGQVSQFLAIVIYCSFNIRRLFVRLRVRSWWKREENKVFWQSWVLHEVQKLPRKGWLCTTSIARESSIGRNLVPSFACRRAYNFLHHFSTLNPWAVRSSLLLWLTKKSKQNQSLCLSCANVANDCTTSSMTMTGSFGRMGSGDCLLLPTVDRKSAVKTILSHSLFLVRPRAIFSRQAVLHELNQFPFLESSFLTAQTWRTESDSREFLCWFGFDDWFLMSASKNLRANHAQFNRKFDILRLQIGFFLA